MDDTFEKLKKIISDYTNGDVEVKPESTFGELGLDSLDQVEIIMTAEEEFLVEIEDEAAERCKTVKDFATLIDTLKK